MKCNKNREILFLFILIGIFIAFKILALEINWPTSPMGSDFSIPGSPNPLGDMVKYFYDWAIALGGIAAFVALLFGGFLYLTSAGDPARLREAKDRIFSAITGLALLLGSWLILNTINPELTILRPPSLEPTEVSVDIKALEAAIQKKSCEYVRFYDQPNYKGDSIKVNAEVDPSKVELYKATVWGKEPKSVRFFQECEKNEICKNGVLHLIVTSTQDTTVTTTEVPTNIICEEKTIGTLIGDVNGDCIVNQTDLDLCAAHFGEDWPPCDWDKNGVVDIFDLTKVSVNLGKTCGCFKEGGACTVELYAESCEWGGLVCGACWDKLGNTNNSLYNIKVAFQAEKKINCAKVTKTGVEE